jgi:phosphatidate cytidylyltransferase
MKDFTNRTVMTTISTLVVICFIMFAYNSLFQYAVAGLVALLTAVAIWEYEQFAKAKGGQMILPALIAISALEVLSFFAASRSHFLTSSPPIIFFIGFLILFALHFRQKDGAVVDLAVSSFGLLYIAVPMGMVLGILYNSPIIHEDGRWWLAYLLIVTKITDIGAYFAGSLWGRRKLAPHISPGKTVEGALFGLVCAILASFAFHLLSDYSGALRFRLGIVEWLCLGLILGVTGQFGDLSESLLKRDANKKDSNALPGFGGVLDMIDSLLFNAPIIYFYLKYIKL